MQDEQYYALANLVKRPMRRWWVKVGSWWMVGLGVLLVSEATISSYAFPVLLDNSFRSQIMGNWPILYQVNERLVYVTPEISVGVALLCAINVLVTIDKATDGTISFGESELRQKRYRLALLSCWPALLPAIFHSLIACHIVESQFVDTPITAWSLLTAFRWFQKLPIWVVLLVAISSVTWKTRWPAWAYYFCGLVAPRAIGSFVGWQFPFSPSQVIEFSNLEYTIFMFIGVMLIYGVFSLYLTQKKNSAELICACHCGLLLLAGIKARFDIFAIDYVIRASSQLPRGLKFLEFWYSTMDEPVLIMYIGAYWSEYAVGSGWAIVEVICSLFWLLAHYLAFSWLMGRDWGRRGK